jgi:hypothetical protein
MSQLVFLANAGGNITFNGTNTANAYSVTVPAANGTLAYIDSSNNLNTTNLVATGTGSFGGTLSVTGLTSLSTLSTTGDAIFGGTGEIQIPSGTTAQRSSIPAQGMIRYNVTNNNFEGYNGSAWGSIAVPAGSNTQVQYNNSGSLAGSSDLTLVGTTTTATAIKTNILNTTTGVLATQNGITGIAKAWVQFGGTTPTIYGSFNIGSITKNGTGDYTFNFTTAMPNANYAFLGSASINLSTAGYTSFFPNSVVGSPYYQAPTTTNCRAALSSSASGAQASDVSYASMAIFSS